MECKWMRGEQTRALVSVSPGAGGRALLLLPLLLFRAVQNNSNSVQTTDLRRGDWAGAMRNPGRVARQEIPREHRSRKGEGGRRNTVGKRNSHMVVHTALRIGWAGRRFVSQQSGAQRWSRVAGRGKRGVGDWREGELCRRERVCTEEVVFAWPGC